MSADPHRIPLSKVLDFLRDLGLDPVDPVTLQTVHISNRGVEVVRARLNEHGDKYRVGDDELATETVTIALDPDT
ncbi:hypothetical protein QQG74_09700 [Micromonospora sp. FIMYZ51]|uniref:hypothetical protein n=1 Tax=Micromonospora sp. FIMYZ51 TaxID=3051832 RepID=UPI0031204AC1